MRSSVCAQLADRSTSSGGGETVGTTGASAGAGAAIAGGGLAVESEGPAQPCVASRTRDNQSELRDIPILGDCLSEMRLVGRTSYRAARFLNDPASRLYRAVSPLSRRPAA